MPRIMAHYHACKLGRWDDAAQAVEEFRLKYLQQWNEFELMLELLLPLIPDDWKTGNRRLSSKKLHGEIFINIGVGYCMAAKSFNYIEMLYLSPDEMQLLKNKRVFISYAKEDYETAKQLYKDLKRLGLSPWLDSEDLFPGQKWKLAVNQAIKNSHFFMTLLSSKSISKNGFVQKEIKVALEILDELPTNKIFIIPIRINDCMPFDEKLQELHWVDLFPYYKTGLEKILRTFKEEISRKDGYSPKKG
jgi:hypothetical protein